MVMLRAAGMIGIDGDVLSIQPMKTKRTSGVVVTPVPSALAESIAATENKASVPS